MRTKGPTGTKALAAKRTAVPPGVSRSPGVVSWLGHTACFDWEVDSRPTNYANADCPLSHGESLGREGVGRSERREKQLPLDPMSFLQRPETRDGDALKSRGSAEEGGLHEELPVGGSLSPQEIEAFRPVHGRAD
ncbi:unnamed protein product [Ixodes hexagonus]